MRQSIVNAFYPALATILISLVFIFRHSLPAVATCTFALIILQSRSTLNCLGQSAAAKIARRALRIAIYLLPALVVGVPFSKFYVTSALLGAIFGGLPIVFGIRSIRLMFSEAYLKVAAIGRIDRFRDLMYFALAGAAQEYFYRGILLIAFVRLSCTFAILISALAFVAEHLLQTGGLSYWDRVDIAIHCYLGLALGTLVVLTASLPAAMIGHTVYNLPNVVLTIRRPSPAKEDQA